MAAHDLLPHGGTECHRPTTESGFVCTWKYLWLRRDLHYTFYGKL